MSEQSKTESSRKTLPERKPTNRRQYTAEEKLQIVIDGLRGEESVAKICRDKGINQNLYYRWHNEFLEAGRERLMGHKSRETPDREIRELRGEAEQLKQLVGELLLENRQFKKKAQGRGETDS